MLDIDSIGLGHLDAATDTDDYVSACGICGDPIDYCAGHSDAEWLTHEDTEL